MVNRAGAAIPTEQPPPIGRLTQKEPPAGGSRSRFPPFGRRFSNRRVEVKLFRIGLGRAVLHAALDRAWNADCYKVLLATGSQRESTLHFYEGAGFQRGAKTYFEIRRS